MRPPSRESFQGVPSGAEGACQWGPILTPRGGRIATFVLVHGSEYGGGCWRVVPLLRAHLAHPGIDLDTHVLDVPGVLAYEDLARVGQVGQSYGTSLAAGVAGRLSGRNAFQRGGAFLRPYGGVGSGALTQPTGQGAMEQPDSSDGRRPHPGGQPGA